MRPPSSTPCSVTRRPRRAPRPRWRAPRACCAAPSARRSGCATRRRLTFVLDDVQDQVKQIDDLLAAGPARRRRGAAAGRPGEVRGRRPAVPGRRRGRRRGRRSRRPDTDTSRRTGGDRRPARPVLLAGSPSTGPGEDDWAAAVAAVRGLPADARVLLICHVNPDGDALGSMLGFGLGLRRLGVRRLQATFPGPLEVPEPFRGLPGIDLLVPAAEAYPDPDLVICFDAAGESRLGDLVDRLTPPARRWSSTTTRRTPASARSSWWTRQRRPPRSWPSSCSPGSTCRWTPRSPSASMWR